MVTCYKVNAMKPETIPIPVRSALHKLGADIRDARRRRRIQTKLMAERAMISRTTLYKIEQGDPKVSMAHYATVLFGLGTIDRLRDIADIKHDEVGQMLDQGKLPQRIRLPSAYGEDEG